MKLYKNPTFIQAAEPLSGSNIGGCYLTGNGSSLRKNQLITAKSHRGAALTSYAQFDSTIKKALDLCRPIQLKFCFPATFQGLDSHM